MQASHNIDVIILAADILDSTYWKSRISHDVGVVAFNRMIFVRYHLHLLIVKPGKEDIGMCAKAGEGYQIQ